MIFTFNVLIYSNIIFIFLSFFFHYFFNHNENILFTKFEQEISCEEKYYLDDDEMVHEANLDFPSDLDISGLFWSKTNFKVEHELKYKSEKDINEMFQTKNLNKEIKEELYLDENIRSKENNETRSVFNLSKEKKK